MNTSDNNTTTDGRGYMTEERIMIRDAARALLGAPN